MLAFLFAILRALFGGGKDGARSAQVHNGGSNDRAAAKRDYDDGAAKAIPGDVKMISGCKDKQTSADVHDVSRFGLPDAKGAGGACTNSLLNAFHKQGNNMTWLELLKASRSFLATNRFTQVPQLSTSRELDLKAQMNWKPGSGNSKSLLIGINYVGQQGELNGCHNDCIAMQKHLSSIGFPSDSSNQKMLLDDGRHEDPNNRNIKAAIQWLVEGAKAGDNLFMHYSGHGGSMRDDGKDEADGMDETLIPVDYNKTGQIRDDEVFDMLVTKIPEGCTLTVIMDCCHSGTILDLPYTVKADTGTIEAVESGSLPSIIQPNPNFSGRMLKLGMELALMGAQGANARDIQQHILNNVMGQMLGN